MAADDIRGRIPAEAIAALKRGNKVEAIKLTRAATGLGLKDSKDIVEAAVRGDADIRTAYESKATTLTDTAIARLVVNLVLIGAVIYFVFMRG